MPHTLRHCTNNGNASVASNLYHSRDVAITERGIRRVILQDGPNHFHVTLQQGNNALYEYFSNLKDINELYDNISRLENEFLTHYPQLDNPEK